MTGGLAAALPPQRYFLLAALASAAMLAAALAFQYVGGLAPCPLCIWQRVPYAAAAALAVAAALWVRRGAPRRAAVALAALCAALFMADAAIAGFHAGVEQGWWRGAEGCSAAAVPAGDIDALRDAVFSAPTVFCDEIAWSMFGLSMAAWNGLIALGLAAVSAGAAAGWRA